MSSIYDILCHIQHLKITERLKDNCGSIHGLLVKCLKDTIQRKIKKTKRKRTASSIDNA